MHTWEGFSGHNVGDRNSAAWFEDSEDFAHHLCLVGGGVAVQQRPQVPSKRIGSLCQAWACF